MGTLLMYGVLCITVARVGKMDVVRQPLDRLVMWDKAKKGTFVLVRYVIRFAPARGTRKRKADVCCRSTESC